MSPTVGNDIGATLSSKSAKAFAHPKRVVRKRKVRFITNGLGDTPSHDYEGTGVDEQDENPTKKRKILEQCRLLRGLPHEILGHIFQLTDPKTLGKLMRVCKGFHEILIQDSKVVRDDHVNEANARQIWRAACKRTYDDLPVIHEQRKELTPLGEIVTVSHERLPLSLSERTVMKLMGSDALISD